MSLPFSKTLAAAGCAALMSVPAFAAPVDLGNLTLAPEAQSFTLDNGLEVVVIPDRRAPIVTHMLWYRVGSADEPPGKSGIAHYLEHLMFKGTQTNPGNTFSATVSRVGGRENAFTSNDYTGYFQQVAKEHLAQMMAFEADRMKNLILTEEVSAPELNVVLEERRSRVDTQPSAELGEALDAALYVNHPYGDPIIGWPDEVSSLTSDDALAFYADHYRPSNAILVIAGDVSVDEVRTLAADTYGTIEDTAGRSERKRPQPQPLRADRIVELRDPRVLQPTVQIAWLVPSYAKAEPGHAEALDLLSEVLGGSNTSRLYTTLVRDDKIATTAGAWYLSSAVDHTRFVTYAIPRDGTSLQDLEAEMRGLIADIAENGISDEELARAKTNLLASVIFAQDSQSSLARIFGTALTTGSTVEDVQTWPTKIAAVTKEDVQAAAARFLEGKASVTGRLMMASDTTQADAGVATR